MKSDPSLSHSLRDLVSLARPFRSDETDISNLAEELSRSRVVMLGASTEGTREFYRFRRILTSQLIEKYGFRFLAIDGDADSASNLNAFVTGASDHYPSLLPHRTSRDLLEAVGTWPACPLRNIEVELFLERLRDWNRISGPVRMSEVFGLDVYSFFEASKIIEEEIEKMNPALAEHLHSVHAQLASRSAERENQGRIDYPEECEEAVIRELKRFIRGKASPGRAEAYYRTRLYEAERAMEFRDRHLFETLMGLLGRDPEIRCIVWAANSRILDIAGFEKGELRQANLGHLTRDRLGRENVSLIAGGTYSGTVAVSADWWKETEVKTLPRPSADSIEAAFHEAAREKKVPSLYLSTRGIGTSDRLSRVHAEGNFPLLEVGPIYREGESRSDLQVSLLQACDGFLFVDETTAVETIPFVKSQKEERFLFYDGASSSSLPLSLSASPRPELRP